MCVGLFSSSTGGEGRGFWLVSCFFFVCMVGEDLQFKDHVEHAVGAVGLQQLNDVGVFQHVADAGLSLQIWKEAEIKHIVHIQ